MFGREFAEAELTGPLDAAVFAAEVGVVQPPLELNEVLFILKVESRSERAEVIPFEEAETQIRNQLFKEKLVEAEERVVPARPSRGGGRHQAVGAVHGASTGALAGHPPGIHGGIGPEVTGRGAVGSVPSGGGDRRPRCAPALGARSCGGGSRGGRAGPDRRARSGGRPRSGGGGEPAVGGGGLPPGRRPGAGHRTDSTRPAWRRGASATPGTPASSAPCAGSTIR